MTEQHPLTDEILDSISPLPPLKNLCEGERCFATRAARWAADWQLEQVIEWLKETEYDQYHFGKIIYASELRKTMRPQEQDDT